MVPRAALDVSHLPPTAFDARAPVWWGNTLLILIETTTVTLLVVSYFYLRQNFPEWPPPRVDEQPPLFHPVPDLGVATVNTVFILGSCLPMFWVDRAARRRNAFVVLAGLGGLSALGALTVGLRLCEFQGLKFSWDDNAYASVVWSILGLHLTYLTAAVVEAALVALWVFLHGLDDKHAVDVTLTAGYWYWAAGIWLPLYLVVYWAPRIL